MKKAYLILFIFAYAIYSCSEVGFPEPDEKESEQVVEEGNLEEPVDTDLDGIADEEDNCPEIANQDQLDLDEDGLGDLCDACPDDSTNTCNDCIDADGDGFLDAACGGDDCDDGNAEIYPGHSEVCDGVDNNCDGKTDENLSTTTCGLGVCEHTINNCENGIPQTCDPFEGASEEICDGLDNDCDGEKDEELGTITCGEGVCENRIDSCIEGTPQICEPLPLAIDEICNGLDDDCNGDVPLDEIDDDGDGVMICEWDCDDGDNTKWQNLLGYEDSDGDGYGSGSSQLVCSGTNLPSAYSTNATDNCPSVANSDQLDTDGDNQGNACDDDDDNDNLTDIEETFCASDPLNSSSTCEVCDGVDNDLNNGVDEGFADTDDDTIANCVDMCPNDPDNDNDSDEICGDVDNCPSVANEDQLNTDGDSFGDACDEDDDDDNIPDTVETNCGSDPLNATSTCEECDGVDNDLNDGVDEGFVDTDEDTIADCVDSCSNDPDNDVDEDGICGDVDNCPSDYNSGQEDNEGDRIGDACDEDDDNDGVLDDDDNCPIIYNSGQEDEDGNEIGNFCDFTDPDITITDINELQAAIDSIEDDQYIKILIPTGTYQITETISIEDKNVAIMAEEGAEVIFESDEIIRTILKIKTHEETKDNIVVIKGIKFYGKGSSRGISVGMGDHDHFSSDKVIIDNVEVTNCSDGMGGGMYTSLYDNASTTIVNSAFSSNSASHSGSGILVIVKDKSIATINNNNFSNNFAEDSGGGVHASIQGESTVTMNSNSFSDNSAENNGGGVLARIDDESTVTMNNNTFTNNSAEDDGGCAYVSIDDQSTVTMNNNNFSNNSSDRGGGLFAVLHNTSTLDLSNTSFLENRSYSGGGIFSYTYESSNINVNNSIFDDNYAHNCGAICLYPQDTSNISITDNSFFNNVGIVTGGVKISAQKSSTVSVTNNIFNNNSAWSSGTLRLSTSAFSLITVISNTFDANSAESQGGSISAHLEDSQLVEDESYIYFINNIVSNTSDGGGIRLNKNSNNSGVIKINYNGFYDNQDCDDIGTCIDESHIYNENADLWIQPDEYDPTNKICNPVFADDELRLDPTYLEPDTCIDKGPIYLTEFSTIIDHPDLFDLVSDYISSDKDGNPRPMGTAFDIGAHEVE